MPGEEIFIVLRLDLVFSKPVALDWELHQCSSILFPSPLSWDRYLEGAGGQSWGFPFPDVCEALVN